MKSVREFAIRVAAAGLVPIYVAGFLWHVACNWFQFGKECAARAEDEWIKPK